MAPQPSRNRGSVSEDAFVKEAEQLRREILGGNVSVSASDVLGPNKKPSDLEGFRAKRLKGLEPSTFCMASRRSSQLSYSRESGRV
jgi:hypothetical protein